MSLQDLTEIEDLVSYEILKREEAKAPYIMQGNPEDKTLDIYHLILAPTHACNLRCKHCYLPDHTEEFLPKDVALRIVDEWSEIVLEERGQYGGIFHVKGGEPFMVPYLEDVLDRLSELQSLRLMMTTNGTFVDENIFRMLYSCNDALNGHVTIIVSLDGATEKTHAILRGKGQFAKTLKFLERLQKYGLSFYLNCVLHKGNIHELSEYIDIANAYGACQVNFLSFVPRGMGSDLRLFQIPHLDVYKHLSKIYENADEATRKLLAGSLPHIKHRETYEHCQTSNECVAAYQGLFYITPDGYVYPCPNIVSTEFTIGNVCRENLRDISDNRVALYKKINPYAGAYLCAGEKMLYERNKDLSCVNMIYDLQKNLSKNHHSTKLESLTTSYCFNRNW
ncbi:MAG: radical SAM protein [Nitrospirae bacterium]|nr:radical SAM protein [Nitrospirota bacterium]